MEGDFPFLSKGEFLPNDQPQVEGGSEAVSYAHYTDHNFADRKGFVSGLASDADALSAMVRAPPGAAAGGTWGARGSAADVPRRCA